MIVLSVVIAPAIEPLSEECFVLAVLLSGCEIVVRPNNFPFKIFATEIVLAGRGVLGLQS